MEQIKHNLAVLVVLVGCLVLYYVGRADSHRRYQTTRESSISACIRASERTSIQAAAWMDAAATRRLQGDFEAGANYEGFADSLIDTLPAPHGYEGLRILAEIERHPTNGVYNIRFNLSRAAKSLQRRGCEESFRDL